LEPRSHRNTQQRRVILEELRGLPSHPTASDLHQRVRSRLPKISLSTVYRNLQLLAEMGTIRKLEMGGSEARFDGDLDHHCHVRCVRCGRLDDYREVPHHVVHSLTGGRVAGPDGYDILGYQLEFSGICPECREQRSDGPIAGEV